MTNTNATTQPGATTTTTDHGTGTIAGLKDKAANAAHVTSDAAHDAAQRAADSIETNPLAVLAGGLALGAIAGALIPKSAQEQKVLGPLGKRLSATATAAAAAARDAGKEQLTGALPDKNSAKEQIRSALGSVVQAATESGKAAAKGSTNA